MAINATAVWRIRTGGDAANGAAYDAAISGAGTDYSQQDAAQLTVTDGACADNTTLTSATGGFTAAMIGNALRIASGTNFTAGYYFITARTDTNTVTLDRNPTTGASATGGAVRVGGAARQPEDVGTSVVAGNTVYVRATAGNASSYPTSSLDYTLSTFFTPTAGSESGGYVKWIGYNGMPTIGSPGLGYYNMTYNWLENLYVVATATTNGGLGVVNFGVTCLMKSCVVNMNLQAGVVGVSLTSGSELLDSEIYGGGTSPTASSGADGVKLNNYGNLVHGCRVRHCRGPGVAHASVSTSSAVLNSTVRGCVGDGINIAQDTASIGLARVLGCTIDGNGGDGVSVAGTNGAASCVLRNNNVTNHVGSGKAGIRVATSSSDKRKPAWGWNNVWNNTTNYTNVTADATDLSVDPNYADAANGDFTPQEATLEGAGFPTTFP